MADMEYNYDGSADRYNRQTQKDKKLKKDLEDNKFDKYRDFIKNALELIGVVGNAVITILTIFSNIRNK